MITKTTHRRETIIEKIISRIEVDQDSGCWLWQGGTSGKPEKGKTGRGYGRISIDGETMAVHKVVYTHFYGIIPRKKHIDHLCKTRLCCNPDHLEMVTHKVNMKRRDNSS